MVNFDIRRIIMAIYNHGITSRIYTFSVAGASQTVSDLLSSNQIPKAGQIRRIYIRASAGGGANVTYSILDDATATPAVELEHVIAGNTAVAYGENIHANSYFDSRMSSADNDLTLIITPAAPGTFVIRIDFEILM